MRRTLLFLCAILAGHAAFASNPQDEQTVRTTYAKLAYVVQSGTVYREVSKHPNITTSELTKKLQANELRFDITEMSSGNTSDIEGFCYYQTIEGAHVGSPCEAQLFLSDATSFGEEGTPNGWHHELNTTSVDANVYSLGSPTGSAQGAVGVAACPGTLCNFSVSLGGVVSMGQQLDFQFGDTATLTPATAHPTF